MRLLYNGLILLLLPVAVIRYYLKSLKEPVYRQDMRQRFGKLPIAQNSLWIHCVSHGETQAAKPLILALAAHFPERTIIVTNMTATGRALSQQLAESCPQQNIRSSYLPFDQPWLVRRAIKRAKPALVMIVETELWPNLLRELKRQAIPTMLINGRLSARSAQRYAKFPTLMREVLSTFSIIGVRDQLDQERFSQIGAAPDRIRVFGNIKFDQACPPAHIELGNQWRNDHFPARPIWIAASTHEGEEALMLAVHRRLQQQFPTLLLLLVPRHPNRFDSVMALCEREGFATVRRSAFPDREQLPAATDIVLGDSMGELMAYYQAADIALVGGSFVEVGGHNVLEPMALSRPTITGPIDFNSPELIAQALAAGALRQLKFPASNAESVREISDTIAELLSSPASQQRLTSQAKCFLDQHRGAKANIMETAISLIQ